MSADLPLWFGSERGTDLSALVEFDDADDDGEGGGLIDDFAAGLLGLLLRLVPLALAIGSGEVPIPAAVLLGAAGAAWLAAGLVAAWQVAFLDEDAPLWATGFVAFRVTLGKIIAIASVVIAVLFLVAMLIGMMAAASSDR